MELALGTTNWLLGKVLSKLSNELVEAWVGSSKLGGNLVSIKRKLRYTQGILHEAQKRDLSDNQNLLELLHELGKAADQAEDVLDELDYFLIQDTLNNTKEAAATAHGVLCGPALHIRHVSRHFIDKWLSCCSCSHKPEHIRGNDCSDADDVELSCCSCLHKPEHIRGNDCSDADDVDIIASQSRLLFNRVDMSKRIKSTIEQLQDLCDPVLQLLQVHNSSLMQERTAILRRPVTTSMCTEGKLYGRDKLFYKIANDMTAGEYHLNKLTVLPVVGPPGIGKTTLTQHLCNDPSIQEHFSIIIWICVSFNFSVNRITQEIFRCIPPTENEGSSGAREPANLDQLQKFIERRLMSKRFLLVLDDVWTCNSESEWRTLISPFTKLEMDGNMILVTTRFHSVAALVKTVNSISLGGLEPNEFWKFFLANVFDGYETEMEKDLLDAGREIVEKLKCSPLAARTVGRLLKKDLTLDHWRSVLEREEWRYQQSDDDIMPALKISYHYLPFHLKRCFGLCALFPEDYEFDGLDLVNMWGALGIVESSNQNNSIEQIGLQYLNALVDNGFFNKVNTERYSCYVMHDLFHELAQCISSHECIRIDWSNFRCESTHSSIRHISFITNECNYSEGSGFYERIRKEIDKMKQTLDIGNLHTLLFIGKYDAHFANIFQDTFKEMKALRVLSLVTVPSKLRLHKFPILIHLRYLKIQLPYGSVTSLPNIVSSFYHLEFLDLKGWGGGSNLPKDMNRLVNLRHLISNKALHCQIPEVGKLKFLQELNKFQVRKDCSGFELHELEKLTELRGSLSICNLENVNARGDADGAKLLSKRKLDKLKLVWDRQRPNKEPDLEDDVLESLKPHPSIRDLCIKDHGGSNCPTWLHSDKSIKMLKSLHLHGVSWSTLPSFGHMLHLMELKLESISSMHEFGRTEFGYTKDRSFQNLTVLQFADLPQFERWVVADSGYLFSQLRKLSISNCPKLTELPFSPSIGSSTLHSDDTCFPKLNELIIQACPQLSLPPLPHTSTMDRVKVESTKGSFSYQRKELVIDEYSRDLAFHNMHKLEELYVCKISLLPLTSLQKLSSLKKLHIRYCGSVSFDAQLGRIVPLPIKCLMIYDCAMTGKELTNLLNCLLDLSYLEIFDCPNIRRLCGTHDVEMKDKDEDEEGLLLFPLHLSISLHKLEIHNCRKLSLLPEDEGGLKHLTSLQSLQIQGCDGLLSAWSMEEAIVHRPFPQFVRELTLREISSLKAMALLSNLRCLTHLEIVDCDNLKSDGFDPVLTQGLTKLVVVNRHDQYSVTADLLSKVARTKVMGSFQLEELRINSISEFLVYPICDHLSATLHTLCFQYDNQMQSFTEEQDQAFQVLTNIQNLYFMSCRSLQFLPTKLYRLRSLKVLLIDTCPGIRTLPKEGLPASLEKLEVYNCSKELKDHCRTLKIHMLKLF
ncbi:hypothetical protein ACP4OV_029017 [Aristida adscensionis]